MLTSVPNDMVKKILLLLDPQDLQSECQSNRYVSSICQDDDFFHEYINKNFDPTLFGVEQWDNSVFQNRNFNVSKNSWKELFQKLLLVKFIPIEVGEIRDMIPIYSSDSLMDINERANKFLIHLIQNGVKLGHSDIILSFTDNYFIRGRQLDFELDQLYKKPLGTALLENNSSTYSYAIDRDTPIENIFLEDKKLTSLSNRVTKFLSSSSKNLNNLYDSFIKIYSIDLNPISNY